ncbi:ABC transporter ATP-binding protein (plasmid) [Rhizobium leguminosarum bv. viciae 248]|uniref:ABC transporter ATP-binding protein n=1 Tax=Rhizobium leguminosarum TaxID=384 RepID=UPI00036DDE56|nr:ABC transporter ATP-binding protein [Rhizobium leguminosarum]MBY5835773.1 ABC transporter ATP-binding protein [Rhizobium leguminosarum]MBY5864767.1 ABC transporter ATP-binding protein [Rhizobium leguminosarum]MCA2407184.1 ABC transporter ATP-binding protein/permease [Rhizobium leguminosarum]NKM03783.1 ATP-binding cassette domain-containing protein [Rhizobium leguminosarum bv. viciae]NKM60888.1 ATP-binding cassette domain-containing protein [Rhizobium leguminosarum bv. viciae]
MTRKKLDFRADAYRHVLGFVFHHWRHRPALVGVIIVLVIASTLAEVMVPVFSGQIVDAIAGSNAADRALRAFVIVVALGLTSVALRWFIFNGIIRLTLRTMADVTNNGFHKVQRFSTDWHANSFAGSTVRKITRGMWALDQLNDLLLVALLPSIVMLVGASIVLGSYWPIMGLIVAAGSLIYIGVTVALSMGFVSPAARLANAWDTKLGGALADAISCNSVVKAFGAENREEVRLRHVMARWDSRTRRTWNRGTLSGTIQGFLMVSMQAGILGTGLIMWQQGLATPGDITFVLAMFFVLQGYLRNVGQDIRNLQRAVNDMEELVLLDKMPLGIEDKPNATPIEIGEGEIVFDRITFQYGAHPTPLYEDFSVTIKPGERVGLVGHSGSGKTTFVKLIQRLYDVNSGEIRIDGQDIAGVKQSSLRGQIAIVQQEPILFHRTLAENIAYSRPNASRREIEQAAKQASAHDFILDLPKGYETLVGERGVKLSGGERQRVAIARAFLADAPVLILDEATSSLDSESEVQIQQAMERLMNGRTTLVIAHRLSTVRALDRLLVFDKGKIVEEGDHQALIRLNNGIYRRLFERQALELTKGLVA